MNRTHTRLCQRRPDLRNPETIILAFSLCSLSPKMPGCVKFFKKVSPLLVYKGKIELVEQPFDISAAEFEKTFSIAEAAGCGQIVKPLLFKPLTHCWKRCENMGILEIDIGEKKNYLESDKKNLLSTLRPINPFLLTEKKRGSQ